MGSLEMFLTSASEKKKKENNEQKMKIYDSTFITHSDFLYRFLHSKWTE